MAESDVYILDLFVRYVLPLLVGYVLIFHLCWGLWTPLFQFLRVRLMRYTLGKYWSKVYLCNKSEIERMFAPLGKIERREGQALRVMEIGIGEGSNFEYYPRDCDVSGVDPEGAVEPGLRDNIAKYDSLHLETFKAAGAEDMSHIEDDSMDAVICTLVLCSVKNPNKVVQEVKRILRKDGIFIFWEHVNASKNDKWIARKQRFLNEFWNFVFGNCHLTRKSSEYIEAAEFSTHEFSTITLPVMSIISTTLFGSATK